MTFAPISLDAFVKMHIKANPGQSAVKLRAALQEAVKARRAGRRCACGNPIWVIGSAVAHYACFTCITGEADPSEDYEIMDAM